MPSRSVDGDIPHACIIRDQDPTLLYKFVREIGRGAFSTVYLAESRSPTLKKHRCAIKELRLQHTEKSTRMRRVACIKSEIMSLKLFEENIGLMAVYQWESSFFVRPYTPIRRPLSCALCRSLWNTSRDVRCESSHWHRPRLSPTMQSS
jgi:serine/threonine protein kinase